MEFRLGFKQGVNSMMDGKLLMAVGTGSLGVVAVDTVLGSSQRLFTGINFLTVSMASGDQFVGIAHDGIGFCTYEASLTANEFNVLSYIERMPITAQGVYDYDVSTSDLVVGSSTNFTVFSLNDGGRRSVQLGSSASIVLLADGEIVTGSLPSRYMHAQGVYAREPGSSIVYVPATRNIGDGQGETVIVSMEITGNELVFSGELLTDAPSISSVHYDEIARKFFFTYYSAVGVIEVAAADLAGNVFELGDIRSNSLLGLNEADFIMGLGGNDTIDGALGSDSLEGGVGHDLIIGGSGHDSVDGGLGDDIIVGGSGLGNDFYRGGQGVDEVRYVSHPGR